MKTKALLIQFIAAIFAFPAIIAFAQPAVPAAPDADLQTSVKTLVMKIQKKLQALGDAEPTEAAFAAELAEFDTLIANNKNAKPEELAQVLMMKSGFYVEVLKDFDKAAPIINRIKAEYPKTQAASHADGMLKQIETLRQMHAVSATLQPGKAFPDFSVTDIAGEPLSISKYKGKVVLVDFWATWCPPCVAEMPSVVAAYEKYHDKGFEIAGISLDKDKSKLTDFIAKNKMPWPQYFDGKEWGGELIAKYGIDAIPATFLIDAEGRIVARDLRGKALEEQLEKLLKK